MRNRFALPLGLVFLALPFAAEGRDTSAVQKLVRCEDVYSLIHKHNNLVKINAPELSGLGYLQYPKKEYSAILDAYPRTEDGLRQQISDLINLRLELERRPDFVTPEVRTKYEALEWLNGTLGLIPGDISGREFLRQARTYGILSREQRLEFIETYASSRHRNFDKLWIDALNNEPDSVLRAKLRTIAARRWIKLDYSEGSTARKDFLEAVGKLGHGEEVSSTEIQMVPDDLFEVALYNPAPGRAERVIDGLRGRSGTTISKVLISHPSPHVRLAALKAFPESPTVEYFGFLGQALRDPDPSVRLEVAERLARIRSVHALHVLELLEKDPDPRVAQAVKNTFEEYVPELRKSGQWVLRRQSAFSEYSDAKLLEIINGDNLDRARAALPELRRRPLVTRFKALEVSDAQLRFQIAQDYSRNAPNSKDLVRRLVNDPIVEIRQLGISLASKNLADGEYREIIARAATRDENMDVRRQARASMWTSGNEHHNLGRLKSDHQLHEEYVQKVTELFGANGARDRDVLPLAAADHVYALPEADDTKTVQELITRHKDFLTTAPRGYEVAHVITDPLSGLKAAVYQSADEIDRPLMVAFCGTHTPSDVIADLNHGLLQMRSTNFKGLVDKVVDDISAMRRPGKPFPPEVVVTGHSLGGAVSHVFTHDLQRALEKQGIDSSKVRVVTWNGLGAKTPFQKLKIYDAAAAEKLDAVNYFVPNDWVSVISDQIGKKVQLPKLHFNTPLSAHGVATIQKAFDMLRTEDVKDSARKYIWKVAPLITRVTGPVTDLLQYLHYKAGEKKMFARLIEARLEWAKFEDYKTLTPKYDWLKEELETRVERTVLPGNRERARAKLKQIELERQKILRERRVEAFKDAEQAGAIPRPKYSAPRGLSDGLQ